MTPQFALELEALAQRLSQVKDYLSLDQMLIEVCALEQKSADPSFWDDPLRAQAAMAELSQKKAVLKQFDDAQALFEEAQAAFDLGIEDMLGLDLSEADISKSLDSKVSSTSEACSSLALAQNSETEKNSFLCEAEDLSKELEKKLTNLELASWFSDDLDHGDAIVTITPGQGGLEAQDWCEMLFKMYLAYCARRSWKVDVNDAPIGEVIGLDRATFTVKGENAYGMLRSEQGVHRLVRISPTDEKKRRQTTFAGVEVLPVLPENITIEIDPSDLRIDVYHASGPGGQGVNTTDSAVRITHLPTNTVVTCQNERSQLQNKAAAMQILKSRLFEIEQKKREAELEELRGPKHEISFGNQIRNYVLYPYQLIKDTRTGQESAKVDTVLRDGDLDEFVVSYHRWRVSQKESQNGKKA